MIRAFEAAAACLSRRFATCLLAICAAATFAADAQTITTVAGRGLPSGVAATASGLQNPTHLAFDASGNLYIADTYNHVVRRVAAGTNLITTVAGTGIQGYSGDGGQATSANLQYPEGLALDGAGNLYIADTSNQRIRRVVLGSGVISLVAGTGAQGSSGDGGLAISAQFNQPSGLTWFGGNLYVADRSNHRIRMIVPGGNVTTVAGTGTPGFSGDGLAATSAALSFPRGIAFNPAGHLYIADTANSRVRRVVGGTIATIAGNGSSAINGDGGPATSAGIGSPEGVAIDASNNLLIAAGFIRRVDGVTDVITRVAGATSGYSGDGAVATSAGVRNPRGVAVASGDVYFADSDNNIVRRVSGGTVTKFAGTGVQEGQPATSTHLHWPRNLALDAAGNVYIADSNSYRVRRLDTAGNISTFAGNDSCCDSGEGVAPTAVALRPRGVALDTSGNVYIAEMGRIRKVSGGVINTIAGNGSITVSGDGGPATAATVSTASFISVAPSGDLYFADENRVRRIAFGTNIISTVAGTGTSGFSGDGGLATAAALASPSGIAVDGSNNIYIADTFNFRIRRVDAGTGVITTIGGGGVSNADGIVATSASLSFIGGIRLDGAGSLLMADGSTRVRRIDLSTGIVTTVAGGTFGFSGDGGAAASAAFMFPTDVALDGSGNLLIADTNNNRIRRVARDTVAPDTSITMSPGSVHFNTTALFTFGATEAGAVFQCSLDGAAYGPCGATQSFDNLALGNHTLLVRAVDAWGNVDATPVSFTFKVAAPTTISSSASHALALSADGKVYAWGNDSYGQLGQGRTINRLSPTQVTGLPPVTQISMQNHVLAVDSFKQVWSWGDNSCGGQLGPRAGATTNRPARVIGASNMTRVGAALCFSTALRTDGTVWVWGAGTSTSTGLRQVIGLSAVADLATGTTHALALKSDGTLWGFGDNSDGQLGLGTTGSTTAATQIPGLNNVIAIAAGLTASMALQSNGTLTVWGRRANNAVVSSPTTLPAAPGTVVAIAMSGRVPYVALADGSVHYFHIVTGLWASEPGLTGITRLSANAIDTGLAVNGGGQLFAFSDNNLSGQLGLGHTTPVGTPVAVTGFAGTLQLSTSVLSDSAIAVKSDGSVWFWGQDTFAQSGDGGSVSSSVPLLVTIPGNPVIKRIAAGDRFSVAVDTTGNVWGWGENILGPLGSPLVNRSTGAAVTGISNVSEIAAGSRGLVVYLKGDGTVWRSGTLPFVDTVAGPIPVPGLGGTYTAVAAGSSAYALRSDGTLLSWGFNASGDLGVGNTTPNAAPQIIGGITGSVKSIAAGFGRAAAVTTSGTVWTWGSGVLGNGGAGGSTVPVQVPGISDGAEIALGTAAALVRRTNGSLQAWGNTGLSDATSQNMLLPYPVAFHEPVRAIALGANHTVGWIIGNAGLAWGFGFGTASTTKAAIGDGSFVARTRPVVLLAASAGGSLDADNWYLDLDTSSVESIPLASIPKAQNVLQLFGSELGLTVQATVKYKASEIAAARRFNNYAFALVPAEFFGLVKNAPGTPPIAELKRLAKANKNTLVLAQLTPAGWTNVNGQLIAYSQSTANAAGSAVNILTGVNATLIPGARFCIGYGESSGSMLTLQSLSEVLSLDGAASTASGVPCVLTGVYVGGASSSTVGSAVTFTTSVVGLSPTGSAQFKDGSSSLSSAVALTLSNEAVGSASVSTSSLTAGVHSIGASYGGDSQNASASATTPLPHVVVAAAPGQTVTTLAGPSGSDVGSTVTFSTTVSGASPSGTVQFKDGAANLGDAAPLVEGQATLRTSSLAIGSHSITAVYSGDGANAASTSSAVSHTVYSFIATTIALTSSAATATEGGSITFTATVTGSNPGGTVTFRDGGTVIGTVTLSAGSASVTISTLQSGQHAVTADYTPDAASQSANQAVSSSATVVTVSLPGGELTVIKAGSGTGTVTSAPTGINCGTSCTASFGPGATVTLTAAAGTGSAFTGWSGGACSGTGTCVVTLSAATIVTATFENPPRLANISTRMQVLTGNDVMIAGFIIGGTAAKTVVVNVAGPSLANHGITNPLANPKLTLVRSSDSAIIATNDNWQSAANAAQIQASGFQPASTLEPAILMTLAPGAYTAIVEGVGGTGVGLVGVFEVDRTDVPLINISTRGQVLTGNDVMIAGFIIQGSGPQTVVINVAGPSLSAHGITNPLANPKLTLVRSSDSAIIATNDNWQAASNAAAIQASGFQPANPLEPAIMMTLAPGAYTAIVEGVGGTGVGLVGVFRVP